MREPIAVIGIGCRMPKADNVNEFWKLLCNDEDAITPVPASRWDADAIWSDDGASPGHTYARWGGFVHGGECYDASFFGLSDGEVRTMDPQQGMVLEVAWQALENAAIPPDSLQGTRTGVFIGIGNSDFDRALCSNLDNLEARAGTGTSYSVAANRLSYILGLNGPSLAVDLACSSALAAVHLACQSLALGETSLALAGGVHLMLGPEKTVTLSQGRLLSRDGHCKAFSALADGYVRGEGCGVVVLKRYQDAVRDGDPVVAVLRGSALSHNGRSNGLSSPLGRAQRELFKASLQLAGCAPASIGYVEAHGSGTLIGDTIEIRAIKDALGEGRGNEECVIGSLKPHIGHLESAAGIAALIKTVLAVKKNEIPGTLFTHPRNPELGLEGTPFQIADSNQSWPKGNRPRRAIVSCFSFGGANANVVVEEAPILPRRAAAPVAPWILPLSAQTPNALSTMVERFAELCAGIAKEPEAEVRFADICFTAATGRKHHRHRVAITASSPSEAMAKLRKFELTEATQRVRNPKLLCTIEGASTASDSFVRAVTSIIKRLSACGIAPHSIRSIDLQGDEILRALLQDERLGPFVAVYSDEENSPVWQRLGSTLLGKQHYGVEDIVFGLWPTAPPIPVPKSISLADMGSPDATFLSVVSSAYAYGFKINWEGGLFQRCKRVFELPTYPFQRIRPASPVRGTRAAPSDAGQIPSGELGASIAGES